MADHMENGPSSYNGGAEQMWERPWTLDEMRKTSTNWSLAADSGLFLCLQDFSQRMLSKTHEIEKQLDGLIRDTKATDSCLHTVFNDFLMLSNTQFIENRVYDDEVEEPIPKPYTQEKQPEQEKTKEQKEAELIPKVQEAVNYGLKVLDSAFEQLDIKAGNSDSEDEEAADRVEPILEPKDLYVDRPLPYLIGSQAFMEQDDVGLGDLSSDEMSIDSDRESVIESEEGKDGEHSDEDFDHEKEGQGSLKKKPSLVSYDDEEEDEDSDIFGESDKDEDELRRDEVGPASFADELAARIKGDTTVKPEADSTSLSSGPSGSKKKIKAKKPTKARVEEVDDDDDDDDDDMFNPPKMEEDEYSPFGGKGGLFSGGKGLFDDDEGDLFSEASKNEQIEKVSTLPQKTEHGKSKKIPIGAVSIFPENTLFGSENTLDSLENKKNDSPVKPKVQAAPKQASLVGGLFDDNDEDNDIFSGKTLKTPTPGGQEKIKPKKSVDLFGGDDGDIFSATSLAGVSQQSKKNVETEEAVQPLEKKLPGATSVFGLGTKNILVEGLKKRRPSTNEESEKSEESIPKPDVDKPSAAMKPAEKSQSRSLFSDDEDSQIFPTIPKSHSKPEAPTRSKGRKTLLSIFNDDGDDDDDEEDLFSSVPKSKSVKVKTAALQPKTTVPTSLFSDDEDQWMSSKPSTGKLDVRSGGMKTSTSAPSRLPSATLPQKSILFEDNDDDDLFAATKESSQKKPQRVSLMFEDEADEDKGSLFGFQSSPNKTATGDKRPADSSLAPSLFGPEKTEEVVSSPVNVAEERRSNEMPVSAMPSPEEDNKAKKPTGAVGLFGEINVLGDVEETTKSPLEDFGGLDWQKEPLPSIENKEKKAKKTTLSLFDDEDKEEKEPEGTSTVSLATQPIDRNTLKAQEQKSRVKSTGVFQDEELLFSQTQQRDNDPDVDLFATSANLSAPLTSSVKPVGPTLFGDDDNDDNLFSSTKPKVPPKPASPVKSKETSSRIGKIQASLSINPTTLLPGAAARVPGTGVVVPGSSKAAWLVSASAGTPDPLAPPSEGGVSFDCPAQVTTLQNANKDRIKGATRRRPQTRAARHLAARCSEEVLGASLEEDAAPQVPPGADAASPLPPFNPVSARSSALTLPVTTIATVPAYRHSGVAVRPKRPITAEEDLFASEELFVSTSLPKHSPLLQPKVKPSEVASEHTSKKDVSDAAKKDPALSIFNDHATVKSKTVKKAKAVPFLDDEEDEGDADIFRIEKRKDSKTPAKETKPDIFQDAKETPSKALKTTKGRSLDASLFNDDVDIFADLTPTTKPKEKKVKKKVETKSIFDDDMDDIFSSGIMKPVIPSSKSKKPPQEPSSTEESGHSIFDDPLNVFGGN
ncbi:WASH complex subunit 2 isoform X2 [Electrophorus electricus]|uniref:WASH complex subunit 2 isoform X2 n=1 Tax=Electrophorus electricus TaxID=8005 RepID=UPI0015CFC9A1|nr:WASH complex subunit 2 isoform X2 [Electrophorus electricus]